MLESFSLTIQVDCTACRTSMPLNGIVAQALCYYCGEKNQYDAAFWQRVVSYERIQDALEHAVGVVGEGMGLKSGLRLKYSRVPAHCTHCANGPNIDPAIFPQAAAKGACACPQCGASIRLRAADALGQAIHPGMRWVVNEQAPTEADAKVQTRRAPIVFACMSCTGALKVDGSKRLVSCTFCKSDNYLPDGLWQLLRPVPKAEPFFFVCEIEATTPRQPDPARDLARAHVDAWKRGLGVGQRVLVPWPNGHRYPGTVEEIGVGQVLVVFPNQQRSWIPITAFPG